MPDANTPSDTAVAPVDTSFEIPDVEADHDLVQPPRAQPPGDGINPQDVGSMPRAEDDPIVYERSPEFHDRPDAPVNRSREAQRVVSVNAS